MLTGICSGTCDYYGNQTISKIHVTAGGTVTTVAGTAGVAGSHDDTGTLATFDHPAGITVDTAGVVYVADTNNGTIRRIDTLGVVTTLAGTAGVVGWGLLLWQHGRATVGDIVLITALAFGILHGSFRFQP